ncbi:hypothetical protein [Pseudomonas sp. F-14 TE3931]
MYSGMMKIEARSISLGLAVEGDFLAWEDMSADIYFRADNGLVVAVFVYGKPHRETELATDCYHGVSCSVRRYLVLQLPVRQSIQVGGNNPKSYKVMRGVHCGAKNFDDWFFSTFYSWPVYYHGSYSDLARMHLNYFKQHFIHSIVTYNAIVDGLHA